MSSDRIDRFRGRRFPEEIIVLCVTWYLRYCGSYRDLEEMMAERGLEADHSTIARWVLHFSPILNDLIRHKMRRPNCSWRVDETYVRPRVINVDGDPAYATAITELKESGELTRKCRCPPSFYLNNIIGHDHRFVKKQIAASQGFRSVDEALSTTAIDASGGNMWSGATSSAQVSIQRKFRPRSYFVRLYIRSGDLMHEYGFSVNREDR